MPTHEYWQFAFVKDAPTDINTIAITRLGREAPLRVEMSNLPQGSTLEDDLGTIRPSVNGTTGDHVRVYWSYPNNHPPGYTLTGGVRILKKTKEFPRGINEAGTKIVLTGSGSVSHIGEYRIAFDNIDHTNKAIWYYTIFYEGLDPQNNAKWFYSPVYSHGRGFALTSETSAYGNQMYNYFPSGIRNIDVTSGGETLKRLCQILGRPFDEIKERLDKFGETRFDPTKVDAAFLPYIDQYLGWPTNFELREGSRRDETANIIDIWKAKGTNNALALALQELTGWNIDFVEGWRYTLTTATVEDFLDPNNAPAGWVEATDGVWADQVNARIFNGTPNFSSPITFTECDEDNTVRNIYNTDCWQNSYGLLVRLLSAVTDNALSGTLALEKVNRLLPYLVVNYAQAEVVEN